MKIMFATTVLLAVSERAHDLIWGALIIAVGIWMIRTSPRRRR
jgi:ABC-type nickel/cobalt efflux system permease component RcnA